MLITIVTWGSDGDVRPFVALALELERAGHVVKLATRVEYKEFVSSYGVNCIPMDWNAYKNSLESVSRYRPFRVIDIQANQLHPIKDSLLIELWRVCQGAEAIIFHPSCYPCSDIAEKLGIPCYAACMQPHHQTSAFPHPFVTNGRGGGRVYNWFSYLLFDQLLCQSVRQKLNQWRKETLNLPPISIGEGIVRRMQRHKIPFLYNHSPAFLPKPSDWPDWANITGYWFLDAPIDWQAPTALVNFINSGSAPIYISTAWNEEKLGKEMVLELLARTGQRIIVQKLDDDFCGEELSDKVFNLTIPIPHEWLFPQMAAVVHHGGLGTTMNSLRAGVPTITIPTDGDTDHLFWTSQVAQSGFGPPPIKQNQLSLETLAAAIKVALNDKTMQAKVASVGKQIRAENGVKQAVEIFHHYLPRVVRSNTTGQVSYG